MGQYNLDGTSPLKNAAALAFCALAMFTISSASRTQIAIASISNGPYVLFNTVVSWITIS
jgi:hypothetical protein